MDGKLHIWYPSAELLQHCLPLSMVMNRLLQVLMYISLAKDQFASSGIGDLNTALLKRDMQFLVQYIVCLLFDSPCCTLLICNLGPL